MNPIVLLLADGNAFFIGIIASSVPLIVRCWDTRSRVLRALGRIIGVLGIAVALASSTPIPLWIYGLWLVVWAAGFMGPVQRVKRIVLPAFLLLSAVMILLEVPYHFSPKIPVRQNQSVYVIGDSISAGIGTSERLWPLVLADISGLKVTNLAQGGATTASALRQENGVRGDSLVLVEIGGNDLLGETSSAKFGQDLDALLTQIPSTCTCAMFELPLLPFRNQYGEIQRSLAKKHGVILIPKKCMTKAIGGSGNTLDGLHLSQKGHNAFAHAVFSMLEIQSK